MTFPSFDLYPGPDVFPGLPIPVDFDGYQQPIEVAIGGLILTATDENGVDWVAEVLDGWYGSPGSTMQPVAKGRAPGAWPGPRQLDIRPMTVAGFVEAPSPEALLDANSRLNAAASIDACLLTVSESNTTRSAIVYRQGPVVWSRVGDTTAVWSIQVQALDPRKFGATQTVQTSLPSTSGGLILPIRVPLFIGSTVVTGTCQLTSPGDYPGPVQLRIDGPCAGPVVTHISSGKALVFKSSLVLRAGEWLEVDMENTAALANGQVPRAKWIESAGWSSYEKGDNEWAFTAVTYDPAARLTVSATPAWQ